MKYVYGLIAAGAIILVVVVSCRWWPSCGQPCFATQMGSISISTGISPDREDRIFSGSGEEVVLTLKLVMGTGTVEVLVNEAPITDGV